MNDEEKNILSHLSDGYKNAQDTIRSLDIKTNILTALSVFGFTTVLGTMKLVWDHLCLHPDAIAYYMSESSRAELTASGLLALTLFVSLFLGVGCLWSCMATLMARGPDSKGSYVSATVLFPFIPWKLRGRDRGGRDDMIAYYDRIREGRFSECDIVPEYHNQIRVVGEILGKKVAWNRIACHLFRWQVLGVSVSVLIVAIMKCF